MVFPAMNSANTWKSPRVMRTTTSYTKRFQRMPSNSDNIEKRDGKKKKYLVFSVNEKPEPVDGQKRWEVSHQQEFIRGGAMPQYHRDTRG